MPCAVTTIGRMAERTTLEQAAQSIGDLDAIIQAGFAYNEEKFGEIKEEFRIVKDRLSSVEYGVRQIQRDFVSLDEEIRGIHKVIDGLNIRVVALERNFGATPLFPVG